MEEPRRMKTREEIIREKEQQAQENAVKTNLEKYVKEMDTVMQSYLQKMREVKAQVDVKYKLSDAVIIRELNEKIQKLEEMEIPKEIQLHKRITHTTDKVSYNFLWWHFVVSLVVILTSICVAVHFWSKKEKLAKEYAREVGEYQYLRGVKKGREEMFYALPEKSREYLKKVKPEYFSQE